MPFGSRPLESPSSVDSETDVNAFADAMFRIIEKEANQLYMRVYGIQTANWWKKGWSSSSLQQRCQNVRSFSILDNIVPILVPLRKFTSTLKPKGLQLKRVATGSVSKSSDKKF